MRSDSRQTLEAQLKEPEIVKTLSRIIFIYYVNIFTLGNLYKAHDFERRKIEITLLENSRKQFLQIMRESSQCKEVVARDLFNAMLNKFNTNSLGLNMALDLFATITRENAVSSLYFTDSSSVAFREYNITAFLMQLEKSINPKFKKSFFRCVQSLQLQDDVIRGFNKYFSDPNVEKYTSPVMLSLINLPHIARAILSGFLQDWLFCFVVGLVMPRLWIQKGLSLIEAPQDILILNLFCIAAPLIPLLFNKKYSNFILHISLGTQLAVQVHPKFGVVERSGIHSALKYFMGNLNRLLPNSASQIINIFIMFQLLNFFHLTTLAGADKVIIEDAAYGLVAYFCFQLWSYLDAAMECFLRTSPLDLASEDPVINDYFSFFDCGDALSQILDSSSQRKKFSSPQRGAGSELTENSITQTVITQAVTQRKRPKKLGSPTLSEVPSVLEPQSEIHAQLFSVTFDREPIIIPQPGAYRYSEQKHEYVVQLALNEQHANPLHYILLLSFTMLQNISGNTFEAGIVLQKILLCCHKAERRFGRMGFIMDGNENQIRFKDPNQDKSFLFSLWQTQIKETDPANSDTSRYRFYCLSGSQRH